MEEYITVDELSERIKFSKQTIYNLIHKKTFILGKHYLKPTPKKILFKWSEIEAWMEGTAHSKDEDSTHTEVPAHICEYAKGASSFEESRSLINI